MADKVIGKMLDENARNPMQQTRHAGIARRHRTRKWVANLKLLISIIAAGVVLLVAHAAVDSALGDRQTKPTFPGGQRPTLLLTA